MLFVVVLLGCTYSYAVSEMSLLMDRDVFSVDFSSPLEQFDMVSVDRSLTLLKSHTKPASFFIKPILILNVDSSSIVPEPVCRAVTIAVTGRRSPVAGRQKVCRSRFEFRICYILRPQTSPKRPPCPHQ